MTKYVTVVYEVVDEAEFDKTNPMLYRHNGLVAVGVSFADLIEKVALLEEVVDAATDDVDSHDSIEYGDATNCDCRLCRAIAAVQAFDKQEKE